MGKGGEGRIHTPAQVRSQGAGSRSSSRGGGGGTSAWRPRRRAPCTMAWMWHAADGGGWPPRTAGRRPRWGSPKEVEGCLRGVSTLCWQRGKTSWRKLKARGRRRPYKKTQAGQHSHASNRPLRGTGTETWTLRWLWSQPDQKRQQKGPSRFRSLGVGQAGTPHHPTAPYCRQTCKPLTCGH